LTHESELVWTQPAALGRRFVLSQGETQRGTLTFSSAFGSLANASYGERQWTFKRAGFLSPRVTVRAPGSDSDLALFRATWNGSGDVEFSSGVRYHWKATNFWNSEWAFFRRVEGSAEKELVLAFHNKGGLFKHGAIVTFGPNAEALPELPILILLGWYLRVLMFEDTAASGAAAVSG
jgi:hypothetical protein